MRIRVPGWAIAGLATVVLAACASGGPRSESSDRNRLTGEEIASVEVLTLYEVVDRLRPRWLEVRAPRSVFGGGMDAGVVVFLGRTRLGGADELKRFGPGDVAWLEYMTGSEAAARLPGVQQANVEGAIVIHMRPANGS